MQKKIHQDRISAEYHNHMKPVTDFYAEVSYWRIVFVVWLTDERCLSLFPAGTIVRDTHHRESLILREQGLNLRRTSVQAQLNEVVQ